MKSSFLKIGLCLAYGYFSILLLLITLQYIPYNTDVAFLRIKQDVIETIGYKFCFFTHVYSSIFLMLFGFIQFSKWVRKRNIQLHKWSGRIYAAIILLFSGPAALFISFFANGGWVAKSSFVLLSSSWWIFTFLSVYYARNKNIKKHQEFAIRSFALTLSAISLRLFKVSIVHLFHTSPMDTYKIVAWLGWTFNLLLAELIIYFLRQKGSKSF